MAMLHVRHSAGNSNPGHVLKETIQPGLFPTAESISHPFGHSSPMGKRVAQPNHQAPLSQHPSTPQVAPWEIAEQAGTALESKVAPGVIAVPTSFPAAAATNPFIAALAE